MDHERYWASYTRGTAVAVAADVARACVLAVQPLVSETNIELRTVQAALVELRTDPGRRGATWTRAALAAEIARHERDERRLLIRLDALREHERRLSAELSRLAPLRESTTRLIDQSTRDYEAALSASAREQEEANAR